MKRHPSLRDLSVDHHHGLVHARRLMKAGNVRTDDRAGAADLQVVRSFLRFFAEQTNWHFREEEEVLLPAFARYGDPAHPSVVQMLVEHVHIRRLVSDLHHQMRYEQLSLETVRETGTLLKAHIRLEENIIFPLIERTLTEEALADLAGKLMDFQASNRPSHDPIVET